VPRLYGKIKEPEPKKNSRTVVFSRTKGGNFGVQLISENKESLYLFTMIFVQENVSEDVQEEMVKSIVGHLETAEDVFLTEPEE
jgi:hypothetical protein